jgi:uncharacterized LabA/DUF88 family protein
MGIGAIFVDGGNISQSLKRHSREAGMPRQRLEYGVLTELLRTHPKVANGKPMEFLFKAYYTAHHDPALLVHREPFYDHLRRNGWTIFDTVSKLCTDGIYRDKGVDLSIALDAYALALKGQIDTLVLLTHDEDFAELFKRLPKSVKGISIGFKNRTSILVQKAAADVIWLDDLAGVLR